MSISSEVDAQAKRFCAMLGRHGWWSEFLDGIAAIFCPAFVHPLLLPAAVGNLSPLSRPMFMSVVHGQPLVLDNNPGPAVSTVPDNGEAGDPPHSGLCSPPRYHGMHGAPCDLNIGGTNAENTKCPYQTVPGLWWRFNVPGLGNVYYVDCCGRQITWKVWCRWASEPNWCGTAGNGQYTCTLTILQKDMKPLGPNGFADFNTYGQVGAPGPGQ